jgi:membrane protease YdiL (CAAX protease family)
MPTEPTTYPHFWRTPGIPGWKPLLIAVLAGTAMMTIGTVIGLLAVGIEFAMMAPGPEDLLYFDLEWLLASPVFIFANSLAIALTLPVAIWLATISGQPRGYLSSVTGRFRWSFAGIAGAVALGMILVYTAVATIGEELGLSVYPHSWWLLAGLMLLTPFQSAAEEYVFRGLVFRAVGSWARTPTAALVVGGVVSAALFAAVHFSTDPWLILFYFSLGLLLSYVTWRTGGLEAAVAIHVANNMIGMALLPFQDLATAMDRSAGVGGPIILLQFAAVVVAVAVIVWLSGRWDLARTGPRVILGAAR